MKIDRENCEAWFLDYYEGNLSKEGVEEMFAFLKINADLQELFDSYDDVSFSPDKQIHFDAKSDLKKPVGASEGINENNYEEYFVGAVENVLNEEEKKQLEKFLLQFPSKREELDLLRKAILEPEEEIVFEHKSELKKSVLINEENFSEYAVAAVDGTLSAEVLIQFNAFISANLVAKKEFELFAKTKLQPETEIVFEGKEGLKKTPLIVTAENMDELAISSLEGLLNSTEQNDFAAAVADNDELKQTVAVYAQTILTPDTSIVFEDKESLKKKEKDRGAFWRITTIRFAAAASIALLIGIFWWNYSGNNPVDHAGNGVIAGTDTSHKNPNVINPNVPNVLANNDSGNSNPVIDNGNHVPPHSRNGNHVAIVLPVVKEHNSFVAIPASGRIPLLATHYDGQVDFSDAYYNSAAYGNSNPVASNNISLRQAAMRWMKKKLDRSAQINSDDEEGAVYSAYTQNKNQNEDVTGFDLTSSAVNAIGQATGSHLRLAHETEGTILTVGKYQVWLNHNK
jgi:hypothetical protein